MVTFARRSEVVGSDLPDLTQPSLSIAPFLFGVTRVQYRPAPVQCLRAVFAYRMRGAMPTHVCYNWLDSTITMEEWVG